MEGGLVVLFCDGLGDDRDDWKVGSLFLLVKCLPWLNMGHWSVVVIGYTSVLIHWILQSLFQYICGRYDWCKRSHCQMANGMIMITHEYTLLCLTSDNV